jgi:hypothetical protein
MLPELSHIGVTELVIVDAPPSDPAAAAAWVTQLAGHWAVATVNSQIR